MEKSYFVLLGVFVVLAIAIGFYFSSSPTANFSPGEGTGLGEYKSVKEINMKCFSTSSQSCSSRTYVFKLQRRRANTQDSFVDASGKVGDFSQSMTIDCYKEILVHMDRLLKSLQQIFGIIYLGDKF